MPRGFDLSNGPNQKTFGTKVTKSAKRMPRGFDLSKGPNQKTFGTKGTKSEKRAPRGFDLSKRSEPKKLRHKRNKKCKTKAKGPRPFKRSEPKITSEESKDGCLKGGRRFQSEPSATIIQSTRSKKNKTPRRQQRARKGGDVFPKKIQNFRALPRLVNKLPIHVPQRKKPLFLLVPTR